MTKNEFKEEKDTTYDNTSYVEESSVSYGEMLQLLKKCSRWGAEQYGNKILVSGTLYSFTVEL